MDFSSTLATITASLEEKDVRFALLAMKLLALKSDPDRTFRELADIQVLMSIPDVDRDEVRSYFERYDLLERYHELE